ncbi:MAG: TonB family protein [Clostridia bacterium]|nr:TonB family protein [Deltaproteobacteria bacterium]
MKVVRACIVEQGRILEERRLGAGESLTVGTGARNTFITTDPILVNDDAKSYALIAQRNGVYELVVTDEMQVRLVVGDRELDTEGLRQSGLLRTEGNSLRVNLEPTSRGRVRVGQYTVIFQFSDPVSITEEAIILPKELRANYIKNLDRFFAVSLLIASSFALLLIIWFQTIPEPLEPTFDQMDETLAKFIMPDYVKEKPKEALKVADTGPPKKEEPKKPAEAKPDDGEAKTKNTASRSEKIRKSIEGRGVLAILGSRGAGSGAVADVFGDSNIGGDLDHAFEGISGVGVATGGSSRTARGAGGTGTGDAASIGGLATAGGGQVGLGGKKEARVATIKTEAPEVDGSLDSESIAKVVRARLRSIQDCYERELKRDATLQGKIEIEFTIGQGGDVDEARVSSNKMGSAEVGDCIVSRVRRWKFPQPKGGSVTVNYPFIFTPSS